MSENLATFEERIAKLESSGRRLKVSLILLPLMAFSLGAAFSDVLKAKSVITEKLIIVDDTGKTRAALYANSKGNPNLELYNADGSLMLNLAKSDDNGIGCIQFFDQAGKFKGGAGGNALK
jgi:hypothetical protein